MYLPKLVALDIGGVCISLHHELVTGGLGLPDGILASAEIANLCMQFEMGKMSNRTMLDHLRRISGKDLPDEQLISIWDSMLGKSIPGMADAVSAAVKRGWKFVYFSNTSAMHMDYFLKTNDFCHLISGAVFSYQVGAMKPDDAMYEAFERQYGTPEFYFDDSAKNIEAGKKRGWNAVLFRSPEQIGQFLK